MDLAYSPEHEKFREEVREFLQQTRAQWRPSGAMGRASPVVMHWQALLIERSYTPRGIPSEYRGYGGEANVLKPPILADQFARVGAPGGLAEQGISMPVATLLETGTPECVREQAARVQGWGVQADRLMEQGGDYR
jgi:alkylation response protein AidB-like acyl-CoA dehydrogenase